MRILLIRHGQSKENKLGMVLGQRNGALTTDGEKDVRKFKRILANYPVSVVYSSDLGRCIKTANILVEGRELKVKLDSRLREINFGIYQGKPYSAIQGDYLTDLYKCFPDGESNNQMIFRVIDSLNDIYSDYRDKTVLIVTHSGPISVIKAAVEKDTFINSISKKAEHNEILELTITGMLNYPR